MNTPNSKGSQSSKTNGLIAAAVTGFHSNGDLDLNPVRSLAAYFERSGVAGVFVNGTTGEAPSLTADERERQAEEWRKAIPETMKLFVHVGGCSGRDARRLAMHAGALGVDAVAAMVPAFFRPAGISEAVNWCAEVASAVPETPFYYYHIPAMNGANFRVVEFLELASEKIPNLAGVKFTFESLDDYLQCKDFAGGLYDVLWGRDEMLLGGLATGAKAAVGSTYGVAAPLYLKIFKAFQEGDLQTAGILQAKACRMIALMLQTGNFFAALKTLLARQGVSISPFVRTPLPQGEVSIAQELETLVESLVEYCE